MRCSSISDYFEGHETSATSLTWVLYELARHPDVQERLRLEIREAQRAVVGKKFTAADYDNMVYLSAVLKVCFVRLNEG